MPKSPRYKDLDEAFEKVQVLSPGSWENETGPVDWYAVADETGIIAYFGDEGVACFFRLALVNARLNPLK